jgi:hypothetical protein
MQGSFSRKSRLSSTSSNYRNKKNAQKLQTWPFSFHLPNQEWKTIAPSAVIHWKNNFRRDRDHEQYV